MENPVDNTAGRTRARARTGLVGVVALATVALTGCSTTMRDLPIPGTGVAGDTVEVRAEFGDALNLAVGAPVKVNGVDMGRVEKVSAKDFSAEAVLTLKEEAGLRQGARARLRYTTPLGELFVDVTNPTTGAALPDGAVLEQKSTATAPSVEDALAQASLLINGGGLDQLQTVTEQLNIALNGNEQDFRTLLDRATVFVTQANATTRSIDSVLDSLDSLSTTLSGRTTTINKLVRDIRPAAEVLRRNTPDFTRLLAEVEKFSEAANGTVTQTRSQLLTVLREIEPVLAEFAKNNATFEQSMRGLVKAAGTADNIVATDYLNISLELHLDSINATNLVGDTLRNLLGLLGFNTSGISSGSLLNLGNILGGLTGLLGLGKAPASTAPRASATGTTRPSSSAGTSTGTAPTDPLGITRLLGGLLGGRG